MCEVREVQQLIWARKHMSSQRGSDPKKLNPGTEEVVSAQTPSLEAMPLTRRNGMQK